MIVLIVNGAVHEDISYLFDSVNEAIASYGEGTQIVEAPEWVREGYTYHPDGETDAEKWLKPVQSGWEYDAKDEKFYQHDEYREILHQRTSNDTLQALRKLREGDQSYDWQGWLNKLDAYNKAVEETKNQATYPESVTYPQYPSR